MARKKSVDADNVTVTFRCPVDLSDALKDLAHLSRRDVSSILIELCSEFVKANRQRITNFRRQAAQPLKLPTFNTPIKKSAAQDVTADDRSESGYEKET